MLEPLLVEAGNLPVESYDWGTLQWLASTALLPGCTQTLGICHLFAGKRNPLHFHPNCEELLHVLAGLGKHRLGDACVAVEPGSTVRIPTGMIHQLINTGAEPLVTVIAFSSGERLTIFPPEREPDLDSDGK